MPDMMPDPEKVLGAMEEFRPADHPPALRQFLEKWKEFTQVARVIDTIQTNEGVDGEKKG